GERITFHATIPFSLGPPTGIELRVNATATDASAFPGTVSTTFTGNTTATVFWSLTPAGNATWSVTCTPRQPSPGCVDLQRPFYHAQYGGSSTDMLHFFAGETVTVAAAPPVTGTPTTITLTVTGTGGNTLSSRAFPGSLQYVFPADTFASVGWT